MERRAVRVVGFALEVVSPSGSERGTVHKTRVYAEQGIPVHLVVDPRNGTMGLRFSPEKGEYRSVAPLKFGDVVELPAPLEGVRIETGDFARYGEKEKRKGARREKKP